MSKSIMIHTLESDINLSIYEDNIIMEVNDDKGNYCISNSNIESIEEIANEMLEYVKYCKEYKDDTTMNLK